MRTLPLLFLVLLGGFTLKAEPNDPPPPPTLFSPIGQKRVQQNLAIVTQNQKDAESNVSATTHNINIIRNELNQLEDLQKEHYDLKKKYSDYLAQAEAEMEKNERSMAKISAYEKSVKDAHDTKVETDQKSQMASAQIEKMDREKWRTETKAKIAKVQTLMKEVIKNLQDIESRKLALKADLKQWTEREQDVKKALSDINARKTQVEAMLKSQPSTTSNP